MSIDHAIALSALFRRAGIKADYIVSSVKDKETHISISQKENERKIESYRDRKLQVLINVEILTEGIDLPQTKTVFLARPTVSKTLMTQMVGRALRGVKAGGTNLAYAVSFIDNWEIPFVSPDNLIEDESSTFDDTASDRIHRELRLISIDKIEEFARILDDTVDTTALESIPFIERIPIGMYMFVYLDRYGTDINYQIMIYNSNQTAYHNFFRLMPKLFKKYDNDQEYLPTKIVRSMEKEIYDKCFKGIEFPAYDAADIKHVIAYYAQKEAFPVFYSFDDIDRNRLDVSQIARKIYDDDMGPRAQANYLNNIWDQTDDNLLRLFFGRKIYFLRQEEIELEKIMHPEEFNRKPQVTYGKKALEDLPLYEIAKVDKELADQLREDAFINARDENGYYHCARCGKTGKTRRGFQVDHIVPLNRGGKTVASNLQILCRKCNGIKGDS